MTTCALNTITIYNRFSKCTVDQSIDISFRCLNIQMLVIIFCKVICLVSKINL